MPIPSAGHDRHQVAGQSLASIPRSLALQLLGEHR